MSHPITNVNILKALIIPMITYGASIWTAGVKENNRKIDILINKSVRLALGVLKSTRMSVIRGKSGINCIEK